MPDVLKKLKEAWVTEQRVGGGEREGLRSEVYAGGGGGGEEGEGRST